MDGRDLPSPDGLDPCPEAPASGVDGAAVGSGDPSVGADALARAIASTLGGVMQEFDATAEGTARSQDDLARSIDRLTGELDKLLEDAPLPFIVQHAAKISSVRKRVSALNLMLKSIQRRIDNIDRMLSTGTPAPHESVPPDIAGQRH